MITGLTASVLLGFNAPQMIIATFGALLPDIDHTHSALGHYVPCISKRLVHRGFTHSLFFMLICLAISPYFGIGILTHIVLDIFNTVGVQLFWPWRQRIKFPIISIHTGKTFEDFLFVSCIILLAIGLGLYHYRFGILNVMQYTTIFWVIPPELKEMIQHVVV